MKRKEPVLLSAIDLTEYRQATWSFVRANFVGSSMNYYKDFEKRQKKETAMKLLRMYNFYKK